jgi:hypothetical protein
MAQPTAHLHYGRVRRSLEKYWSWYRVSLQMVVANLLSTLHPTWPPPPNSIEVWTQKKRPALTLQTERHYSDQMVHAVQSHGQLHWEIFQMGDGNRYGIPYRGQIQLHRFTFVFYSSTQLTSWITRVCLASFLQTEISLAFIRKTKWFNRTRY